MFLNSFWLSPSSEMEFTTTFVHVGKHSGIATGESMRLELKSSTRWGICYQCLPHDAEQQRRWPAVGEVSQQQPQVFRPQGVVPCCPLVCPTVQNSRWQLPCYLKTPLYFILFFFIIIFLKAWLPSAQSEKHRTIPPKKKKKPAINGGREQPGNSQASTLSPPTKHLWSTRVSQTHHKLRISLKKEV